MKARRANPVKIGAFVIGGVAILVVAVLLVGSGRLFTRTHSFVSYFAGSVNGLRAGAPVKFKGVELGKVTRIRIPFWLQETDPPIAVFYALDEDKLEDVEDGEGPSEEALLDAIRQGLRAQLETDSIVTGVMHLALSIVPDSEARLHDPIEGVMEIPTLPPPMQEIGAAVHALVDRLSRYEFEALLDSLKGALDGVGELSRAPEVRSVLQSLDRTLTDLGSLIRDLDPLADELARLAQSAGALASELQAGAGDTRVALASVRTLSDELAAHVGPLTASLREASERMQEAAGSLQAVLDSTRLLLDPEAPLAVELRDGLRELSGGARAARALFELLERDPAALLHGKVLQSADSR